MKKTLEYKLLFALNVARANPDARILFAFSTNYGATAAWHCLMGLVGKPNGFQYRLVQRTARHDDGGLLMIRSLEDRNSMSGMQVTHAWVDEACTSEDERVVASKIRVTRDVLAGLKEPPGVYDDYKVTRVEDY